MIRDEKVKWVIIRIELVNLPHLQGYHASHFVPALNFEGRYYIYAGEDNGVKISLDPKGVVAMLTNQAGLEFFEKEVVKPFIPDDPPSGDEIKAR
jgi:hypothetical protein